MYYKKIELDNGNTLLVRHEEGPDSPRNWDNLGIITAAHPRYSLSDNGWGFQRGEFSSREEHVKFLKDEYGAVVIKPLYLYDHSGLALSTTSFVGRAQHAEWDSGMIGFIFATRADILNRFDRKKLSKKLLERVNQVLENEVELFDLYIQGDVFYFTIENSEGEVVDSCGGFFGSDFVENALTEHAELNDAEIERLENAEWKLPEERLVYA